MKRNVNVYVPVSLDRISFPYMHDGRFTKLSAPLNHYTSGMQQSKALAAQLRKPVVPSANAKVNLVAFLLTLTDRNFLFNYSYPKNVFVSPTKD